MHDTTWLHQTLAEGTLPCCRQHKQVEDSRHACHPICMHACHKHLHEHEVMRFVCLMSAMIWSDKRVDCHVAFESVSGRTGSHDLCWWCLRLVGVGQCGSGKETTRGPVTFIGDRRVRKRELCVCIQPHMLGTRYTAGGGSWAGRQAVHSASSSRRYCLSPVWLTSMCARVYVACVLAVILTHACGLGVNTCTCATCVVMAALSGALGAASGRV